MIYPLCVMFFHCLLSFPLSLSCPLLFRAVPNFFELSIVRLTLAFSPPRLAVHFVNCYSFARFPVVTRPYRCVKFGFFPDNLFSDFGSKSSAHIRRMVCRKTKRYSFTRYRPRTSIPDSVKTLDYLLADNASLPLPLRRCTERQTNISVTIPWGEKL